MDRRGFLGLAGAGAALGLLAPRVRAYHDELGEWRGFRLTYHVELPQHARRARLWVPLPEQHDSHYQRTLGAIWWGKADAASFQSLGAQSLFAFVGEWRGATARQVGVSIIVKTLERHVHIETAAPRAPAAFPAAVQPFLKPSRLIPTDGIVRAAAQAAARGADTPLAQARRIYDWVVEEAYIDPAVPGCGRGAVRPLLESGRLGGQSADISALFVALCRALGIPARLAHGIRLDDSALFKSLGRYPDVSRGQHCRAEFYLAGSGWVPVDPAGVCEVQRAENLPPTDPRLAALREKLFGAWEMNWCVFNHSEDVELARDAAGGRLPFFVYPQAEIGGEPRDALDPASFSYRIESREMVGTGVKF